MQNLVDNAIKHHDKKQGTIELNVEKTDGELLFSVRDDGPGIAEEYHEKIFEIFQTLKPRDRVEGSGMGLTYVKKAVEGAGGRIRCESQPGAGTTFLFTWPG